MEFSPSYHLRDTLQLQVVHYLLITGESLGNGDNGQCRRNCCTWFQDAASAGRDVVNLAWSTDNADRPTAMELGKIQDKLSPR
mgnify:FL=1